MELEEKYKTRMGNEARRINKDTATSKTTKERKIYWECEDQQKIPTDISDNTTGRNKSGDIGKKETEKIQG